MLLRFSLESAGVCVLLRACRRIAWIWRITLLLCPRDINARLRCSDGEMNADRVVRKGVGIGWVRFNVMSILSDIYAI
jgi:hypothetical protein